ncbi:phosphoadenosine phosphosulfate reductase family protein [Pseudomonas sp. BLCC-B13]|uniref:phosphoadenosine phosphosulfate reductase domain-containing protein n=1 Tax=Pseudomonas sp. BLCC-B13 TaxID=3025314 RepID=UPI00234E4DDE|nr:phosphoadenosine phosphosulfate reductase family protein [Pseudomonas sp. BLCC-B13]MDC7824310.1 phosphoadenosine phosphosulfate reductase family protein [Pseudomonas sp. BLCC-B13]
MEFDFSVKYQSTLALIQDYYLENDIPWVVGFSGGKDSSLVVKLIISALKDLPGRYQKPIHVFYCDTGVEIPVLAEYIRNVLNDIYLEGRSLGLDLRVDVIKPRIEDRYFVKVVGKGYPPPNNKFRWCTDRLRIDPVQRALKTVVSNGESIVVLGTRYNESQERDKILTRNSKDRPNFFVQSGHKNTTLFCPISEYDTDEVWMGLGQESGVGCINISEISNLYKSISGECPIIRLPDSNPCSKGRFGCWTCTVVRKDKATVNLIERGYDNLKPLLEFRNWILEIRDNPAYRCAVRRNGVPGRGPFRLTARREILGKLLEAQSVSGYNLLSDEEIKEIKNLWLIDESNEGYKEDQLNGADERSSVEITVPN